MRPETPVSSHHCSRERSSVVQYAMCDRLGEDFSCERPMLIIEQYTGGTAGQRISLTQPCRFFF